MAMRATHVESGKTIAVGPRITPDDQAVIDEIYQNCGEGVLECREHDNDPRLAYLRDAAGQVHGAWVYLQYRNNKSLLVMAHHPNGTGREFKFQPHLIPVGKSDQHQWYQDYISRAVDDVGFPVNQEVYLPSGTFLDVQVQGPIGLVGFEVQHSFLSLGKVRARTRKAISEGIPLVWCADHKDPDWAFKVPHFEANEIPDGLAPRGSWTVTTGPRRIIRVACSPRNADRLPRCLKPRRRNWCGGWHPVFEPMRRLVVDSIAQQVPAGELIPLDTRMPQGVILTTAACYDLWHNEFADHSQARERQRNDVKPCGYVPQLQALPPPALCSRCGQHLLLVRPGRDLCEKCRIELGLPPRLRSK